MAWRRRRYERGRAPQPKPNSAGVLQSQGRLPSPPLKPPTVRLELWFGNVVPSIFSKILKFVHTMEREVCVSPRWPCRMHGGLQHAEKKRCDDHGSGHRRLEQQLDELEGLVVMARAVVVEAAQSYPVLVSLTRAILSLRLTHRYVVPSLPGTLARLSSDRVQGLPPRNITSFRVVILQLEIIDKFLLHARSHREQQ